MISRRAFLLGSLAPLALRALPVGAQESCGAEAEIVALADYVLANRSKLPKLQSRRNGTVSAYLKIRYQPLTPEQIEGLIGPLVTGRVDRGRELLIGWRISVMGLEAMLSTAAPEAESELLTAGAGLSMLRAAVLTGEVPTLFDKIAALPESARIRLETGLVQAVVDLDDASALAIASEAVARGLLLTGGGLIATHGDAEAWRAFIGGLADKGRADALTAQLYWLPALRGRPALPRPKVDAQGEMARSLFHQVLIAAVHMPERDYLQTYLNQSGDFAGAVAAAAAINDLTRDGADIDMETAGRVVSEAIREASAARDKVDAQLAAIRVSGLRYSGDDVRAVLDQMLAVEAFKAAAAGTGTAPAMVEGASKDFVIQLPAWREAAEAIATGGDLAPFRASGLKLGIVANLFAAIGKFDQLAKFLTSTVPNADSIRLAEAFAEALDRRCGGHLAFPGEAVTMPGMPLFRFDPRT